MFIKNKYLIKNKYDFFVFMNIYEGTLLYKLINFYYIMYNNYNYSLKNKVYNNYNINWDCDYSKKHISSYNLIIIYKKYIKNMDIDFFRILNISIELWNDLYLFYLNNCEKCDISNNYVYNKLVIAEKKFKLSKRIEKSNNLIKNIKHNYDIDDKDQYILIFQYVEVLETEDGEKFEFNFDFLNKYHNYPDTVMKKKDIEFNYNINDNNEINIIGWYKNNEYSISKNNINEIYYNNNINIKDNENLYIYVLFEKV